MRLPVVPTVPWPSAVPPSYQVVPMEDSSQVLGALSQPAVSVVQLTRGARSRQLWPQEGSEPAAARADTRASLSAGAAAASDDAEVVALLDASFAQAPPSVRGDMRRLLRLFARCAMEEGGATADTPLAVRLVVSDGVAGACSQLHTDRVALRLSCSYLGAGTLFLPDASVNRGAYLALQRRESLPSPLQLALRQPWGWAVYNGMVRWPPWASECRTQEGDAILMKGVRWRRGTLRTAGVRRARPALTLTLTPTPTLTLTLTPTLTLTRRPTRASRAAPLAARAGW